MMELILWRHAEAHDAKEGQDDLERALTPRGEKQAARMSAWLERQLPQGLRVVSSPARRTEQTAQALGRKYKLRAELLPDGTPTDLLELVQWEKAMVPCWWWATSPCWGKRRRICWAWVRRLVRFAKGLCGGCVGANAWSTTKQCSWR